MTLPILISNARILTASSTIETGWLLCENGKISQIGEDSPPIDDAVQHINAHHMTLLPGFIDLHVHGAVDYEAMDATPEALTCMAQFYAQHGVTAFLATTWTDSYERILAALQNIKAMQGQIENGATLLGAHLEGPYLNPTKCGAQNTSYIRRANRAEAMTFLDLDVIKLVAIAPEYSENHWLIGECLLREITVSAAHTAATYEDMQQAISRGVSQSTHTFNAMTGLHHREPGVVGAVLTEPEVRCELIADNIHVHPAAMKLLYLAKGIDHVILISDAIRSAGMPDGEYTIDERTVTVTEGVVRLEDGTLAGSTLTMDRALANFMHATGQPLDHLWRVSSLNAAQAIHIDDRKGSIEVDKDADLILVDKDMKVYLTIAEGRIIYHDASY